MKTAIVEGLAQKIEDKDLIPYNSGQSCKVDIDCGKSGCNGEICGSRGPATICYRPPEFWEKLKGKKCLCIQNTCKWGNLQSRQKIISVTPKKIPSPTIRPSITKTVPSNTPTPDDEYCTDPNTNKKLGLKEAYRIAQNSECGQKGQLTQKYECKDKFIFITMTKKNPICMEICKINIQTKEVKYQIYCFGVREECIDDPLCGSF